MSGDFTNWHFATTNKCPSLSFSCNIADPQACARDQVSDRSMCCDPIRDNGDAGVCWLGSTECKDDGSTLTCGDSQTKWCCLADREICTKTKGQINICWSSKTNPIGLIPRDTIKKAKDNLRAENPAATSIGFLPNLLAEAANPTPTPSTSSSSSSTAARTTTSTGRQGGSSPSPSSPSTSSSSSSTRTRTTSDLTSGYNGPDSAAQTSAGGSSQPSQSGNSTSQPSSGSSSSELSAGAAAGIAVGSLVVVLLISGSAFYLWWRKRKAGGMGGASAADKQQRMENSASVAAHMSGAGRDVKHHMMMAQAGYPNGSPMSHNASLASGYAGNGYPMHPGAYGPPPPGSSSGYSPNGSHTYPPQQPYPHNPQGYYNNMNNNNSPYTPSPNTPPNGQPPHQPPHPGYGPHGVSPPHNAYAQPAAPAELAHNSRQWDASELPAR